MNKLSPLFGAKGPRTPVEDPNDLRSRSTAEFLELISDGVIEGWADSVQPGRSIFFNDTPVLNENGDENFKGVAYELRTGINNQEPIVGFFNARGHIEVGQEVTKEDPRTVTITDTDIDLMRVTVSTPQLFETNAKTGDVRKSQLRYIIEARSLGSAGPWTPMVDATMDGKTTSGYQRSHRFNLPQGGAPYEVQVSRITDDSEDSKLQNKLYFESYDAITTGKFTYPNSALIGMTIDAEQFGSSVPTRSYDIKGRKIRVPSNYKFDGVNHASRRYEGPWNGTFQVIWSDNPAYVLLDLLMGKRVGLGLEEHQIDKAAIYSIGRYCDGVDANGNFVGVPDGQGGFMPRHTFNGVIDGREEAYAVLNKVAATFRGLLYWSAGMVIPVADRPAPIKRLVNQADVINGKFTYSSTAIKARHTVAVVTYTDPTDGDRPAPAIYENRDGIIRYGYNKIEVSLLGCRNRIEALRYGKWLIQTEQQCIESVTYRAGWDHLDVMPGDLIEIADPNYAGARMGGRLVAASGSSVTLDAPLPAVAGVQSIAVHQTDGSIVERGILAVAGFVLTLDGPVVADSGAVYILTASSLGPRPFRVIGVTETEDRGVYEISAIQHDPDLYARVDETPELDSDPNPPYQDNGSVVIDPVTMLRASEDLHFVNGLPVSRLSISWLMPNHPAVVGVEALVQTPGGVWQDRSPSAGSSIDIDNAPLGLYVIRVTALTNDGRRSRTSEITYTVLGKSNPPGPPTNLAAKGGLGQITLTWVNPPDSDLDRIEVFVSADNNLAGATLLGTAKSTSFTHSGLGGLVTRYYWVRAVDLAGNVGDFNGTVGTQAMTEILDAEDLGQSVLDTWGDLIVRKIPAIDFTFLNDHIRGVTESGPYYETILEALRLSTDRWQEIKTERGVIDNSFAAVDHDIKEHADSISAWASEVTMLGAEFDDNVILFGDSISLLAEADSIVGGRITQLRADMMTTVSGAITSAISVAAGMDSVIANSVSDLRTEYGTNIGLHADSISSLSDAYGSAVTQMTAILARTTASEVAWANEIIARASGDGALLTQIDQARAFTTAQVAALERKIKQEVLPDYALSESVLQLESRVSSDYVTLQEVHQTVIGDPNNFNRGGILGKWTVAIDLNGHVGGIHLLAEKQGDAPRNSFIVVADTFMVAQPAMGMIDPKPVFTIKDVEGRATAVINAKTWIEEATIDTLRIGPDQVTVPRGSRFPDRETINFATGTKEFCRVRIPPTAAGRKDIVIASYTHLGSEGVYVGAIDFILHDEGEILYAGTSQPASHVAFTYVSEVPTGKEKYYMISLQRNGNKPGQMRNVNLAVIGAAR